MHNKNLWSPWRYEYLRNLELDVENVGEVSCDEPNFISKYWNEPALDQQNYVVNRNDNGIIFLNRYPYANGHLLVALGTSQPMLMSYLPQERRNLWELVETATSLMYDKLKPQGVNIGINEGMAGGAGIPQHLHVHVVPRWNGDTNFMATIGEIRVIPSSLQEMWSLYKK
jgi:ATP adenylyltransferase